MAARARIATTKTMSSIEKYSIRSHACKCVVASATEGVNARRRIGRGGLTTP
jgi:hypothetical protein